MEPECEEQIRNFWQSNTDPLPAKLSSLGIVLSDWSIQNKLARRRYAKELTAKLASLSVLDPDDETLVELLEVKLALNLEVDKNEKSLCGSDAYPNENTTPCHADSISVYTTIWSTNLPQKVKINAWRFIKNYLPTTSNLALRRLHPRLGCCFRDMAQESESLPSSHPFATRSVSEARWSPPPADHVKVNFDASYLTISRESVSGVLIRDVNGLVLAACVHSHLNVPNSEVAKALACDQVVSFARSLSFRREIVEGDSSSIIKKVQSSSLDKSDSFAMIVNVKRRISDFANITFHHVRRSLNELAHVLAKLGRLLPLPKTWMGEAPILIEEAVLRDRWWIASSA
ncbi:hypothetical protein V6N12_043047 [Hibiscus sabdariffa]|uniref:RNase H type-1 domain-containing protein n=1 Tax=Hibiscus sabdariffa TaxID=183260 RepID=A0ABR2DI28_9ROSI